MPSKVANGTPFNKKLHLISRSTQSATPKFTSAKQVNLNVRHIRKIAAHGPIESNTIRSIIDCHLDILDKNLSWPVAF